MRESRAGAGQTITGAGGSGTENHNSLRERAGAGLNTAGVGGRGTGKSVPLRPLL